MLEIVIASNNRYKVKEIKNILKKNKLNAKVFTLRDVGFNKEIKETGETIKENAILKAREVRKKIKDKIIISDDSGLEVFYLANAPGVYSARFAGESSSYKDNNLKLLKLLQDVPKKDRKSVFKTVMCIIFPDGKEYIVEGKVRGYITTSEIGNNGFGYDPVFYLPSLKKTYAQLSFEEKNKVSHRSKAVKKVISIIKKNKNVFQ